MEGPLVTGLDVLVAKDSAVDAIGQLRQAAVEGVKFRPVRSVPHEDGTVADVVRAVWPEIDLPILPVHITTVPVVVKEDGPCPG